MKTTQFVRRVALINIWKEFKDNPNKAFILKDFKTKFGYDNSCKNVLSALLKMNLIENVITYYRLGKRCSARREINGYKLKRVVEKRITDVPEFGRIVKALNKLRRLR